MKNILLLDKAKFTEEYICQCGVTPTDSVLRTYEAIARIAYLAYMQGIDGKPFELPFPVINT